MKKLILVSGAVFLLLNGLSSCRSSCNCPAYSYRKSVQEQKVKEAVSVGETGVKFATPATFQTF
ncbi:MAG: hypothetical protein ACK5JS_08475 [Mangrovibacterium sp.]